jgi:hypothetical protein
MIKLTCMRGLRSETRTLMLLLMLASTTPGCVLGGGDNDPVLSVDLLWDLNDSDSRFLAGYCDESDVIWMEWTLQDAAGRVLKESPRDEPCADGIDFHDLRPGVYSLVVTGFDENDDALWGKTCRGLEIERFSEFYACDIPSPTK